MKVEYLEHPTDSRFMGAESVINFVMKKYEFGGYTKLSAGEYLLIGYQGDESLYSKFSYKRMTYDLYAGSRTTGSFTEALHKARHSELPTRKDP